MGTKLKNKITIVTSRLYSIYDWRFYKNIITRSRLNKTTRGPSAVCSSLIRGFTSLGQSFQLNPPVEFLSGRIIVLSSVDGLDQVLKYKSNNSLVLAGPNLVVFPSEIENKLTSSKVNKVIVNSDWTYNCYAEDLPEIMSKLTIWPAGVDIDYWQPTNKEQNVEILFYIKDNPDSLVKESIEFVKSLSYQVNIIKYGQYQLDEFKSALNRAKLAVYFSQSESQGISLMEAWAMDVPTLVWNPGFLDLIKDKSLDIKVTTSSAPYLTPHTGEFFTNIDEFKTVFIQSFNELKFAPRDWVLNNMTDQICAQKLINEFRLLEKRNKHILYGIKKVQ